MRDELTGEIRDVLIFSPQGMHPLGEKYNNIFQSGYIVGSLDNKTLKFTVETPSPSWMQVSSSTHRRPSPVPA